MLSKLKKTEKYSFLAITILMIALIVFIPTIINLKRVLSIGDYKIDRNYVTDYSEGNVGINVKVRISHWQGDRCRGSLLIKTISSGNIQVYGITEIEYSININNSYNSVGNEIVNPATQVWSREFTISVWKNDIVSCIGTAEIRYNVSGSEQNIAYNFDLSYKIPINVASIFYEWDLPFIWLVFLYFIILIVVGFFFARKLNYIRHVYTYPEEMKKRDKDFFKYLSHRKSKEKK